MIYKGSFNKLSEEKASALHDRLVSIIQGKLSDKVIMDKGLLPAQGRRHAIEKRMSYLIMRKECLLTKGHFSNNLNSKESKTKWTKQTATETDERKINLNK